MTEFIRGIRTPVSTFSTGAEPDLKKFAISREPDHVGARAESEAPKT
jgi:hypothetical protein